MSLIERGAAVLSPRNKAEEILVDTINANYKKYLDCDREMTEITRIYNRARGTSGGSWGLMEEGDVRKLDILSRIKAREQKQMIFAIQAMKQLQTPPLNISLKTETATINQNQQNVIQINDPQ